MNGNYVNRILVGVAIFSAQNRYSLAPFTYGWHNMINLATITSATLFDSFRQHSPLSHGSLYRGLAHWFIKVQGKLVFRLVFHHFKSKWKTKLNSFSFNCQPIPKSISLLSTHTHTYTIPAHRLMSWHMNKISLHLY